MGLRRVVVAGVAAATVAVSGCGGGGGGTAPESGWLPAQESEDLAKLLERDVVAEQSPPAAVPEDSPGAPQPTSTATAPARPSVTVVSGLDGRALMRSASNRLQSETYRLVYEIKGSDPDVGDIDGTLTVSSRAPRQAFGISGRIGGDTGTFMVIQEANLAYLCVEGQGDSACLKTESNEQAPIPLPAVLSFDEAFKRLADSPSTTAREVAGQTIAGRAGRCFEVSGDEGNGLVCIQETDGLVLLMDGQFGATRGALRLKEYVPAPSDRDFEPPYEVIELP